MANHFHLNIKPAKAWSTWMVPEDLGTFFLRGMGFECLMSYTGLLQYQINIGRVQGYIRLMTLRYRLVWYSVHETDDMSQLNDQISVLTANSCNMYRRHRCTIDTKTVIIKRSYTTCESSITYVKFYYMMI